MTRLAGIDWAARPPRRAAAVLRADGDAWQLERLAMPLPDNDVLALCRDRRLAAVGVDVSFAWPAEFAAWVAAWHPRDGRTPPPDRDAFRFRHCERLIRDELGKQPLSVSADLLGLAARTWAGLLVTGGLGAQVDMGTGAAAAPVLVEVYPGAMVTCLAACGLDLPGNPRRQPAARTALLTALQSAFHLRTTSAQAQTLAAAPDALDAVLAAFNTAAYLGLLPGWQVRHPRSAAERASAQREGWAFFPLPPAVGCQ